jgi:hypothetical protein
MITMPDLQSALLDLLKALDGADIRLIVGGGFGIILKTEYVREREARTLLSQRPESRSTNDLDLFLRPELLIESDRLKPLADAIDDLGYRVVPGAQKYQFVKPGPKKDEAGGLKIDILTGPQSRFQGTKVKADDRRARPEPSVGIHAHPMNEATTLEEGLLTVTLEGMLGSGDSRKGDVYLPNPYTFLMMKLFAFADRLQDGNKDFGRYHALDMYSIMATTMEEEWSQALELRDSRGDDPYVLEAGRLVSEYFSALDRLGMIRLRESPYYREELQLDEFMSALQELFPHSSEKDEGASRT